MDSTMTVEKSTHKVEVIRVDKLLKHENADSLSKVKIYEYTSLVRTVDWKEGDLAAFIPPDSEVDVSRAEFVFLAKKAKNGKARIRTEKLRGIVSYGLLVHAPEGSKVGDDVADALGITHYEPQIGSGLITGGEAAKPPSGIFPKYDVDAFLRFGREVFIDGEPVVVTEKINGANAKFVFQNGEMHCGSRTEFKKEYPSKPNLTLDDLLKQYNGDQDKAKNTYRKIENWKPPKNLWWVVLDNCPAIRKFCEANSGFTIYGEAYGMVGSNWNYGIANGKYTFAAFDVLKPDGSWLDFPDFNTICKKYEVPQVPIIHESIPFNFEQLVAMADRPSVMPGANWIAEGIVVNPIKERWNEKIGRVKLKIINPNY